jgi:penicillin amidase
MRRIVDFSNLNNTQMIIPTGQSGLHRSPHYSDQAELYHKGLYRTTWFDKDSIINRVDIKHLELYPK